MELYGKSLFSYISEVRLNEAHETLSSTEVPMKIIAKNLGYSHVNHFINAFGKQFGYSPGSLRKKNESRLFA
jgi:AraC-like DNA-binding protein